MDASEKLASENYAPSHQMSIPDVSDQEVAGMTESKLKLTLGQRIVLAITGRVFVCWRTEDRTDPGGAQAFPFYAFRCRDHGLVVSRPHGYGEFLKCPQCWAIEEGS